MHLHALCLPAHRHAAEPRARCWPDSPSTSEGARGGEKPRPCEETMNPYIGKRKNPKRCGICQPPGGRGRQRARIGRRSDRRGPCAGRNDDAREYGATHIADSTGRKLMGGAEQNPAATRRPASRDLASAFAPCIHEGKQARHANRAAQSESPSASSNDPRTSAPGKRQQLRRTSSDATT